MWTIDVDERIMSYSELSSLIGLSVFACPFLSMSIISFREDFYKFHKNRRAENVKLGRIVRQHVETMESRRERDEARSEAKRLQVLLFIDSAYND